MDILGIDPGSSLMGYGIIRIANLGHRYKALEFGVFKTLPNIDNKDKILEIYNFFDKLIKKSKPTKVAIEKIYFFKNAKTVIDVSEVRGVIMLAAVKNGVEICEFTPLQVKQAVSTYGRAEKEQVRKMVKIILDLKQDPRPDDVTDALAIAICCANTLTY